MQAPNCNLCNKEITHKNKTGICRKCYKTNYEKQYCLNRYRTDKNFSKKQIIRVSKYRQLNSDKVLDYNKKYRSYREKTDISYKLANYLRSRLTHAVKNNQKAGSAVKDLGCSIEQLKLHLESKWQSGMTWENYGRDGWHIDHIVPLSEFDLSDHSQIKIACCYTNLQPLWAKDNLKKGTKNVIL